MKLTKLFLVILLSSSAFFSCKKEKEAEKPYECATCTRQPQALAANDNSSKGIYKGIFVGSSGTIKFDLANNGSTMTAVLVIDGTTINLSANVAWQAGQSYVAPFTGMYNGQPITINFSVGATGTTPTVTSSSIPDHPNAAFTIIKETSSSLVEAFEGTYTTTLPENGTFNMLLSRPLAKWSAIARKNGTTAASTVNGIISGNNLIDPANNNRVVATISGDGVSGSFVDNNGKTVKITGQRTL